MKIIVYFEQISRTKLIEGKQLACRQGTVAQREMAEEILKIVRDNWESLAVKYSIPRGRMEDMRPVFSACYEHL